MQRNERIVPLVGASNFRDLGGYPIVDGGFTRWGSLYRSDALHELTEPDIKVLRDIGLKTILDLRMEAEVSKSGRGRLGSEPARYHHLSVIDEDGGESRGIPAPTDDDLSNRYMWYLDIGRGSVVQALNILSDSANYPLVFHCAAGKDRTGVLAALVLDIVGVERGVIVEDYVLTASRMQFVLERILRTLGEERRVEDLPPNALTVQASTMEGFLESLDRQYGGARQWALAAGVPSDSLHSLSVSMRGDE
jgi:protein-tyrosine phosphatase